MLRNNKNRELVKNKINCVRFHVPRIGLIVQNRHRCLSRCPTLHLTPTHTIAPTHNTYPYSTLPHPHISNTYTHIHKCMPKQAHLNVEAHPTPPHTYTPNPHPNPINYYTNPHSYIQLRLTLPTIPKP